MSTLPDNTKIQSVLITLEGGRELVYTGPKQVDLDNQGMKITGVKFTEGKPLPKGTWFEEHSQPESTP